MNKLREELQIGMIYTLLKKKGVFPRTHKGEDWDDLAHSVYLRCLENEKYWDKKHSLPTYVVLQIRDVLYKTQKYLKDVAESEAVYVGEDALTTSSCKGMQEESVLLEEILRRLEDHHIVKLMGYSFEEVGEMFNRSPRKLGNNFRREIKDRVKDYE